MLAVTAAVLFGMLVIGCGNGGSPTGGGMQSGGLEGTWYSEDEGGYMTLNDGSFEISISPNPMSANIVKALKGNYTTSGNQFTMMPALIHGDFINLIMEPMLESMLEDIGGDLDIDIGSLLGARLESKWYTESELKSAMRNLFGVLLYAAMGGDSFIGGMFEELTTPHVGTYVLNGDSLTITYDDDDEPSTFIRQQ